jgi:hypothetical protein
LEEVVIGKWKKGELGDGRNIDWEMEETVTGRWKRQ